MAQINMNDIVYQSPIVGGRQLLVMPKGLQCDDQRGASLHAASQPKKQS